MKKKFLKYQAQTTDHPLALEISHAEGSYIYDINKRKYLDFVSGVSASNLGHRNKLVSKAVKKQIDKYWHVMVYGEFVQEPTVKLCELLSKNLPKSLSNTYLTNSGTEAVESAMKLAKRITGRTKIIAAKNGYHGNTQGAMSIMGFEDRKRAYRPLLPDIDFIEFNNDKVIKKYPIDLGFDPKGPKRIEGDGKTPEGRYYVNRKNPKSAYHLSLGISYPNKTDKAEAKKMGKSAGKDIFIHGRVGFFGRRPKKDWTWGCVAVSNREIEEIYAMVDIGTPIWIYP